MAKKTKQRKFNRKKRQNKSKKTKTIKSTRINIPKMKMTEKKAKRIMAGASSNKVSSKSKKIYKLTQELKKEMEEIYLGTNKEKEQRKKELEKDLLTLYLKDDKKKKVKSGTGGVQRGDIQGSKSKSKSKSKSESEELPLPRGTVVSIINHEEHEGKKGVIKSLDDPENKIYSVLLDDEKKTIKFQFDNMSPIWSKGYKAPFTPRAPPKQSTAMKVLGVVQKAYIPILMGSMLWGTFAGGGDTPAPPAPT